MIKTRPYDFEIVMNEILQRELERFVRAGNLIPGDPACTAPVFLICIPRRKGTSQVKEFRKYCSRSYQWDATTSVSQLPDQIKMKFSVRMVCEFRKLNDITMKKHYPLPLFHSILQRCYGMKYISNTDFKAGYLHFVIQKDSRKFFHIVTPWGSISMAHFAFWTN